jgi:hypothetical protein
MLCILQAMRAMHCILRAVERASAEHGPRGPRDQQTATMLRALNGSDIGCVDFCIARAMLCILRAMRAIERTMLCILRKAHGRWHILAWGRAVWLNSDRQDISTSTFIGYCIRLLLASGNFKKKPASAFSKFSTTCLWSYQTTTTTTSLSHLGFQYSVIHFFYPVEYIHIPKHVC